LQSKLYYNCKVNFTIIPMEVPVDTKISELRKARKLSQQELADAVGVTRQTITSLETGKYTASLVLAWRIARYFDLAIEEVFDFSGEKEF